MTSPLDLEKYRVQDDQFQDVQQETFDPASFQPIDLDEYKMVADESTKESVIRGTVRSGARVLESILGIPGDLARLGSAASRKVTEKLGGEEEPNFVRKAGEKLLLTLPTSDELKVLTSWLTGGYTDPKTAKEELGDDIAGLASLLAVPAKDPRKLSNIFKSIGKAITAKGASKTAEELGAGPKTQIAAEIGTLFLMGLKGKAAPDQLIKDKYTKANSLIPEGSIANTKNLSRNLRDVRKELSKGISTPTKKEVISAINELDAKAATGAMEAEELIQSFRDLNERMTSKGLFDEISKSQVKNLKFRYGKVKNAVNESIDEFGKQNPEFLKEWKEANQAFATLQDSRKAANFISSRFPSLPSKLATGLAIELFTAGVGPTVKTVAGIAGLRAAFKGSEIFFRVTQNKTLAKHYAAALQAAVNENAPAFINSLNKLEEGLRKDQKRNPIELQELQVQE
jgi:hypothetical protein